MHVSLLMKQVSYTERIQVNYLVTIQPRKLNQFNLHVQGLIVNK